MECLVRPLTLLQVETKIPTTFSSVREEPLRESHQPTRCSLRSHSWLQLIHRELVKTEALGNIYVWGGYFCFCFCFETLMLYSSFLGNASYCSDLTGPWPSPVQSPFPSEELQLNAAARSPMSSASLSLHPSMSSETLPPQAPLCNQLQMQFCGIMLFTFLIFKFSSAHPQSPPWCQTLSTAMFSY